MPENNKLEQIKFPQVIRFNEKQETKFKNNLDSIKVKLLSAPTMDQLESYIPQFVKATWMENTTSCNDMSRKEKWTLIKDVFFGRTLPTAMETINLVFEIDGISLQEVTHILRHRNASFSADCSADKWWTLKNALVPNAIELSSEGENSFYERYKMITEMAKELYCEMIDSKKISILDARYILPRNLETFYYMRMPLKDAIAFIKQRIDRQIQPETDNVIAYQMYIEILKAFPVANGLIDIDAPAYHFINTARSGKSSNIYMPEKNSDLFEWNKEDFIYDKQRSELNGTNDNTYNYFYDVISDARKKIAMQELINDQIAIEMTGVKNKELV